MVEKWRASYLSVFKILLIGCKQVANFILHFVKKPRRCLCIVYVFCLIQNKIGSLSLNHRIL